MEYAREYGEAFMALAKKMKLEGYDTPYKMIEEWEGLIEQIKNGYPNIQPELEYDLGKIREPIQTFVVDPHLCLFKDHQEFKEIIEKLDKEFIGISIEHPKWKREKDFRWWSNRILKYGSKEYADFMNNHLGKDLGIFVETV